MSSRYDITQHVLETLPATLRAARINAGITVRAGAAEIGISKATLARLESARSSRINMATVLKVLAFIRAHPVDPG